ncbi:uncharacterized protein LOC121368205 [Gigantopelta aegis]|uniref:uncharacterized protein LOC121368205 n=1 Tax=Gigantopelta aegis TaxID=1735272 RepID=UPI001B88B067|nr:uncharacterized protein LOC121368205 [Gigantopelta aegis]
MGEIVRKYRPIKLIGVIFTCIAVLLVIISVAASDWVDVTFRSGNREHNTWGLWEQCYSSPTNPTLTVCVHNDWMAACAALTLIALFACIGAVGLGILGLFTHNRMWYVIAGVLCTFAAVGLLICSIIYPVKFSEDIQSLENGKLILRWDVDWTYGVGLGGMFFMVASAVFFFLKQEEQDLDTYSSAAPAYNVNSSYT